MCIYTCMYQCTSVSSTILVYIILFCFKSYLGIKKAREIIMTQGRPNAPEVIIVITDGKSTFYPQTLIEANMAKADGEILFNHAL